MCIGSAFPQQPLILPCHHLMCYRCIQSQITTDCMVQCAQCHTTHSPSPEVVTLPAPSMMKLLVEQDVTCDMCKRAVKVKHLDEHRKSEYSKYTQVTVQYLMNCPLTVPLSPIEEKLTSYLIRRKMNTSGSALIRIQTEGYVRFLVAKSNYMQT